MRRVLLLAAAALSLAAGCEGNINDDDFPLAFTGRASLSSIEVQGNLSSDQAAISANSRFAAFRSSATNLYLGDTNNLADVFVRDLATGETVVASIGTTVVVLPVEPMGFTPGGVGEETEIFDPGGSAVPSNGASSEPAVTGLGERVYFASFASNLDWNSARNPSNTNVKNIYWWDRVGRVVQRVSMPLTGKDTNGESSGPSCAAGAKGMVYQSLASNIVSPDSNGWDIFFFDDTATRLVSVNSASVQANGDCTQPRISADGRYVVFVSTATNLDPLDTDGLADIYWKDLQTGECRLVTLPAFGPTKANGPSAHPSVSSDGRYVVFESLADNLVAGDTNVAADVFLKDLQTGIVTRLSVGPSGIQADGASRRPSISADGATAVFESSATNLIILDTNGRDDVFIVDLPAGAPRRVSVRTFGVEALGGDSTAPRISSDGSLVCMESTSPNLVDGDTNSSRDVFYRAPLK